MDALRKLLIAKGFKVTEDYTFTKLESRGGPDASTSSMAEYINECRNAKGFRDYKIVPNGNGFLIATDYDYGAEIAKLDDYATTLIQQDIDSNYASIRFDPGSFGVGVVGGKLVFNYVMICNSIMRGAGAKSKHTDERPELERRIIEYAMEILPEEIQPKIG